MKYHANQKLRQGYHSRPRRDYSARCFIPVPSLQRRRDSSSQRSQQPRICWLTRALAKPSPLINGRLRSSFPRCRRKSAALSCSTGRSRTITVSLPIEAWLQCLWPLALAVLPQRSRSSPYWLKGQLCERKWDGFLRRTVLGAISRESSGAGRFSLAACSSLPFIRLANLYSPFEFDLFIIIQNGSLLQTPALPDTPKSLPRVVPEEFFK